MEEKRGEAMINTERDRLAVLGKRTRLDSRLTIGWPLIGRDP